MEEMGDAPFTSAVSEEKLPLSLARQVCFSLKASPASVPCPGAEAKRLALHFPRVLLATVLTRASGSFGG